MSKKYYDRLAQQSVSGKKFECEFGLKVLKKFGWSEGKGLGKNEDGTEDCVQIKKREKDVGLGGDSAVAEAQWDNWWSDAYNSAAKKMTIKNPDKADKKEEDASSSDSECAADGGRITAVKNASRMKGKLARIVRQEGGKIPNDSDDSDSDSVGLSALAAKVQAKRQEKGLAPVVVNKIEKLDESWAAKAVGTKQEESKGVRDSRTDKVGNRKRIEAEDAECEETIEAPKKSKKIKVVDEDEDAAELRKEKKSKKKNIIEEHEDVDETRETKKTKKKKKRCEGTESA